MGLTLSVIITTHNRRKLLRRAIDSVRGEMDEMEIIVVDDASTDGTAEEFEQSAGISYIRLEQNQGTAAARNAGIKKSLAPVICFLDDDDYRLPGSMARQLSRLEEKKEAALVYGKVLYTNQANELTGESNLNRPAPEGDVLIELLRRNFITLSSVMIRKSCFNKVGLFDSDPSMLGIEDWDMWLRVAECYPIVSLNEAVAVYRKPELDSGQWYSDMGRQFYRAAKAYKAKWFKLPAVKDRLGNKFGQTKDQIMREISDIILFAALNHSKNSGEKRSRIMDAIRCRPGNLASLRFYKALGKSLLNKK